MTHHVTAAWAEVDSYDILAATPGEARPDLDEQISMMRTLLADRFKVAFHREKKEMAVYLLQISAIRNESQGKHATE